MRDTKMFQELQHGRIDRSLLTDNASAYFSEQALKDFASSLGPLGAMNQFTLGVERKRGGMTFRSDRVAFESKNLVITIYEMPDGKIEQFLVAAAD
jgi:D-alanyl-D-alanine carboxypeptidase